MSSIADPVAGTPLSESKAAAPSAPAIALPVAGERELRLDLFRGMALWLIFVDHVFLFTIFLAEISYVATRFENPLYSEEMGIMDFLKQPDVTIVQALLLRFRPVNMDVLPLYIVLMLFLPVILWLMKWKADVTLVLSAALYALTWHYDWYLSAYPNGFWAFNPFA